MGLQVPAVLPKTCGFVVRVQVKPATGVNSAGTGVGWAAPTRFVPVCHPTALNTQT